MRVSGPMAVDNLGFQTVWRVSISERPTPEWIQHFGQQHDATMLCKPTLVQVDASHQRLGRRRP